MIKLVIGLAGVTLSAIGAFLILQTQSRSSSMSGYSSSPSLFQSKPDLSSSLTLVNDIKEIFGLPPIGSLSVTGKFGGAGGSEGVGYLPPKSLQRDSNGGDVESTTPFFRIIISAKGRTSIATSSTTSSSPPRREETSFESTTVEAEAFNVSGVELEVMGEGERTTEAAVQKPTPTLLPPSVEPAKENEVIVSADSEERGKEGSSTTPSRPNGLYLPPNREYLPPTNSSKTI